MQKIESIALSRMRNNEHFQFMTDVDTLITTSQPAELGIEKQYPTFKTTFTAEDASMRAEFGSLKSKSIDELDNLRDQTWQAILLRVKSAQLSPFANEAESAEVIIRIIDRYGDIRASSYNEETAGLTNLVTDLLLPANAEHLNKVAIQRWVPELKSQNEQFQTTFNERNTELSDRISGDVKAIRLQIDPIYEKIVEKINASVVMEVAKPVALTFISELNEKIKYYKTTLSSRTGRAKNNESAEKVAP